MTNREDLIQTLARLDPATFVTLISSAYQRRHGTADGAPQARPDFTGDTAAIRRVAGEAAHVKRHGDRTGHLPSVRRPGATRFVCWR